MVRLSGALDLGVEVERGERRRILPTNQGRGINRADASRASGTRININTFNPPTLNNRSDEVLSGRIPESNFKREVQHHSNIEHDNGIGSSNRRYPVKLTTQVQNQQRLRPKLLSTIPRVIKQESIEMEPLLSGSATPPPSTLPPTSRKDNNNRIHANTSSAHVMHHRNPVSKRKELHIAPPRQYNNTFMDDEEEDDIVCCEDSFRHEGTKNICTIFIWAALVFFIMNRFFLHMSMYLHRGEERKEVLVVRDSNFTSLG